MRHNFLNLLIPLSRVLHLCTVVDCWVLRIFITCICTLKQSEHHIGGLAAMCVLYLEI